MTENSAPRGPAESPLQPILDAIAGLRTHVRKTVPQITRGTVTGTNPTQIVLDGDTDPLADDQWIIGTPLVAGQRVLTMLWDGHRAILGASTGPTAGTIVGSYYMASPRDVSTTAETPILRMSFQAQPGRQYLISTGNIPYYVAGGSSTYSWYRLRYSTSGPATASSPQLTTPLVPVGGSAGNGNLPAGPIAAQATFFGLGSPGGQVSVVLTCAQGSAASGICRTYPVEIWAQDAGPSIPRSGESL